jgi:hypothetical protein
MGITFVAVWVAMFVAHRVMDHWRQSTHQAANKGRHGCRSESWIGRRACLAHVATYTLGTGLAVLVIDGLFADVSASPAGVVFGQLVSAVTHYWADRRFTLEKLAAKLDRTEFFALGKPRKVAVYNPTTGERMSVVKVTDAGLPELNEHGEVTELPVDNPCLGTGAYALDQSWHEWWLGVAAVLTAVI